MQVHQKAEDGQEIRTRTACYALGRLAQLWTSYYGTQGEAGMNGAFSYVPAASYLPHPVTQYDALGQVVRVETPDGSTSTSISCDRSQIAEDASGHVRLSHSDALRRMTAVNEALVDWSDEFTNGVVLDGWACSGTATETGGTAKITGRGSWSDRVHRALVSQTEDDQGILISLRYDPGAAASAAFLDSGAWAQPEYRRFGLYIASSTIYLDHYFGTTKSKATLMSLATGAWYRLPLKIDDDGTATAAIWQRDGLAARSVLRETRPEYASLNWKSLSQIHTGVGYLDDYDELTFHTTTYTYDTLDNLTLVTDADDNDITMTYDGLGRKTETIAPDMGRWYCTYDPAGNLLSQVDANKQATNFSYDARDQVTWIHGEQGPADESLGSASLTTDASGGVVSEMRYYAYGATRSGSMPADRPACPRAKR